jgi:SAM-dependent methyltransferase
VNRYTKNYYEQNVIWDKDYLENEDETEKIINVIESFQSDIHKLLDIGCGNGAFINILHGYISELTPVLVGFDISKTALNFVKTDKCNGNISDLPFRHQEFDIVTALEVLEHLPIKEFERAILEIQRVCKNRIIITVPNNDDLQTSLATCPECFCKFSPCFHIRSFNDIKLLNLFTEFRPTKIIEIGPLIKYYNTFFLPMYRFWKKQFPPVPPATAICPQCGYQNIKEMNFNEESHYKNKSLDEIVICCRRIFKSILSSKKQRWIMAVYDRWT